MGWVSFFNTFLLGLTFTEQNTFTKGELLGAHRSLRVRGCSVAELVFRDNLGPHFFNKTSFILDHFLKYIHLTNALLKKVDAFQLRCLRRILKLAPTFVDRSNTNMAVIQKASSIAYPDDHDSRSIKLFSFHYNEKRGKLLGHIIRADSSDPLRQISLEPHSANRIQYGKKRCGRPRQNWLHYTKSYVYENKLNFHSYEEGPQDDSRIYNAALQRSFWFTRRRLGYADAVFVLTIWSKHGMAAKKKKIRNIQKWLNLVDLWLIKQTIVLVKVTDEFDMSTKR